MWAVSHLVSDLLISSVSQAPCCSFHNSKESKAPWSSFCLVKKTANYLHMTCRLLQKERPYNSQPWKALLFTGPGTSGTLLTCKPPYSFPLPTYWVDMQWWDLTHHPLSHTLDQREVDRFSQNPEWLHATNKSAASQDTRALSFLQQDSPPQGWRAALLLSSHI